MYMCLSEGFGPYKLLQNQAGLSREQLGFKTVSLKYDRLLGVGPRKRPAAKHASYCIDISMILYTYSMLVHVLQNLGCKAYLM